MSFRRVVGLAAGLLYLLLIPVACELWPSDGDRLRPTLDVLAVPSSWEAVETEVIEGGFIVTARATRKYLVDGDPLEGYPVARRIAEQAGFIVRPNVLSLNGCEDGFPPSAMDCPCGMVVADDCRPSYTGGPIDHCSFEALRWHDLGDRVRRLSIWLGPRGVGVSVGNGDDRRYVADPDRAAVTISVYEARREDYLPLPSWPPE